MTVITYDAKREIEKLAYLKAASNISVAASDDSFNSSVTDLSGLLNNQWINVTGYANAANNGWFQASANSTSAKIAQDTTTGLVTEGTGPAVIIQGHVRGYGQQYSIEFTPRKIERSVSVARHVGVALDRSREVLRYGRDVFWDITTGRILEANLAQWREFLASIEAGEPFYLDPYGTIAAPGTQIACEIDDPDYRESRIGTTQRYTISFRVRAL